MQNNLKENKGSAATQEPHRPSRGPMCHKPATPVPSTNRNPPNMDHDWGQKQDKSLLDRVITVQLELILKEDVKTVVTFMQESRSSSADRVSQCRSSYNESCFILISTSR